MRRNHLAPPSQLRHHSVEFCRRPFRRVQKSVGPEISRLLLVLPQTRQFRKPTQPLRQHQTQHQRKYPQLRDRQRRPLLIPVQKADDTLLRQPVRRSINQLRRQMVNPQPHRPAIVLQHRQNLVVIIWQTMPNIRNVRSNQIRVVQQPLRRRRYPILQPRRLRQIRPRPFNHLLALPQKWQQRPRSRPLLHLVANGQIRRALS